MWVFLKNLVKFVCLIYITQMLEKVQPKTTWDLLFKVIILTFVDKFWGPGKKRLQMAPFCRFISSFLYFFLISRLCKMILLWTVHFKLCFLELIIVFMSTNFFLFRDFFKFTFVATVFEIECCAFGDIVRTHWFIVENFTKIGSTHPEILRAELDL